MYFPSEKDNVSRPVLLKLSIPEDFERYNELQSSGKVTAIFDEYLLQVNDLILCRNPHLSKDDPKIESQIQQYISGSELKFQGLWAFYPWSGKLVHVLAEKDFAEVRTSRNLFKINREEQSTLAKKRIGVVGLSVGQSAAVILSLQRSFVELRIADFDDLRLTNLNRIRAGIHQLGDSKLNIAAREIWELDPFLNLTTFPAGVTSENLDSFISKGGNLDIIIDECDSLSMKIELRMAAKKLGIPVIMETSDRGMLDVERFDLDQNLSIFHGLIDDIEDIPYCLKNNPSDILFRIIDLTKASERGTFSMELIGKEIRTWPQLAEDVIMGGAIATKAARMILLGAQIKSGRYYFDLNEIISQA